jgi:xanthine/CO dehydrogenase XdhC/CoxF family maturation factor
MQDIPDLLRRLRDEEEPCVLATVIETRGSASAQTGSKAVYPAAIPVGESIKRKSPAG